MNAARAFGIAWRVDPEYYAKLTEYGIDLEQASGQTHHLLPVPSVFIVGAAGKIRFVYSNADHRVRIDTEDLLAAARKAAKG